MSFSASNGPPPAAGVAGERHDQMLPGDGVSSLVVANEDQRPRIGLLPQNSCERLTLGLGEGQELTRTVKCRYRPAPFVGSSRRAHKVVPAGARMTALKRPEGAPKRGGELGAFAGL